MPQETPNTPLKRKTALKAGGVDPACETWGCGHNHNQTLSQSNKPKTMKLKTALKAGTPTCPDWACDNHNQTFSPRRV